MSKLCHQFLRYCIYADTYLLQMQDLKDNIEEEVHKCHDEYLKMESHIKLYIKEMEQAIPSDE